MTELLTSQSWLGTFYPPDQPSQSFGGQVTYTPGKGPRLEYAIPYQGETHNEHQFLYGVLSTGDACTLAGRFSPYERSFKMKNNYLSYSESSYPFRYLVLGAQFPPEKTYDSFRFSITGLQSFFTDNPARTPSKNGPIMTIELELGAIEVHLEMKGVGLSSNLDESLISNDPSSLAELQKSLDSIKAKNPRFIPFFKQEARYSIHYKPSSEKTIPDGYVLAENISNLFSLLFFEPTKIERFDAIARTENDRPVYLPVYPSVPSETSTLEKSQRKKHHHRLPLNAKNTSLETLISNWLKQENSYQTIVTQIQSSRGLTTNYDLYSSIILNTAQLEGIAISENNGTNKWAFAVNKYATPKAIELIQSILGNSKSAGELIFDLRNEISHHGKPRLLLNKLNSLALYQIANLLELIIVRHSLNGIGLPNSEQESFMDYWVSMTANWEYR